MVKEAKSKVFPTVVFIKCVAEVMESGVKQSRAVSGSGVLISAGGEVLSNWHVVDRATDVRCLLQDGRAFNARVVGADKDVDVALLKLELPADTAPLPFATLGDASGITEGDFVMAMGAPYGLARSVSIGIISCVSRYLPSASEYSSWLQTDASISPGNSGGPLVNTRGEVIGINTRGMGAVIGGDTGFAVPIDAAMAVVQQIRKNGRMEWSWTGVQLQPLKDFNRNVYFPGTNGVLVAETDPGSPARLAGLQAGDRLVRLNGKPLVGITEEELPLVRRQLGLLPLDQPATLELVRKDQNQTVLITPRAKGQVQGDSLDCPRWDFTVQAINQFDNPNLYFQRKEGVFVFGVKYPGNAANAGLTPQDILLSVEGKPVKTVEDVRTAYQAALTGLPGNHRALLSVLRNGALRQVVLDYAREYNKP